MDELECPYCGARQSDAWELCPYTGELECDECGKEFYASIQSTIVCSSSKLVKDDDEELQKIKKWKEGSVEKCPYCGSGALAEISSYKGETWNYLCEDCNDVIHVKDLPEKQSTNSDDKRRS